MRAFLVACAVLATACAHHHGDDGGGDDGATYDHLELTPAQSSLTVQLDATATQTYQVFGVTGDTRTDITANCALAIDQGFGAFAGATVTVGPHGGKANVTAACGAQTAAATLQVNVAGVVVFGTAPPNSPDLFTNATLTSDPNLNPVIQYPLDQAVSPRNIPPIETQWAAPGADLFHVALVSDFCAVDVYTTDLQATLSAADWEAVAGTAAGALLTFTVESMQVAAPATKYASTPVTITMSHDTIDNSAIYYWASSQGNIMSQTFGDTGAPSVVKNDCTACHSVSRAGSRIGYSRCVGGDCGPGEFIGFLHYDPLSNTWVETVDANAEATGGSYTTFAPIGNPYPDDSMALAMITKNGGILDLMDPDTGAEVPSNIAISSDGPGQPRGALMPDWSADGTAVVFTSTPTGATVDLSNGSIAKMSYQYTNGTHVFGEPQFIVPNPISLPQGTYTNFFFPSFSPDGQLIAFNAARDGWRNFTSERAAGQRLMVSDANGAWVLDLTAMNGPADVDITWPHWAPGSTNDYYWLVFSSERDYGHEVTAGNTAAACVANGVAQCKQIWIGAIAKSKVTGTPTVDPSAPPMWMPGQDTQADNISPYWSLPASIQ
ncbi:MAG TPA: hypothetical protein VGM88_13605 [Kofleriaceae bacterium]|jgi:hypothetical protein